MQINRLEYDAYGGSLPTNKLLLHCNKVYSVKTNVPLCYGLYLQMDKSRREDGSLLECKMMHGETLMFS